MFSAQNEITGFSVPVDFREYCLYPSYILPYRGNLSGSAEPTHAAALARESHQKILTAGCAKKSAGEAIGEDATREGGAQPGFTRN